MFKIRIYPYILFASLFIIILTPTLFTDGMFMDGTIYSVISRNLAEGKGSFWHLHFSDTIMNEFNGHPPLAFYLTSVGFKIFGDNIFVERVYSLITGLIAAGLSALLLKFLYPENRQIRFVFLFTWLLFPLVFWTYSNNMLENTVTVFVLLSILFYMKSINGKRLLMLLLSGLFLSAGFLSKGFTSLFIWSVPFFYWFVFRKNNFKRMLIDTSIYILTTVVPVFAIYIFSKDAEHFFIYYFNEQILGSIKNAQTVNTRLYIVGSLLNEMIIPFSVFLFFMIILKIQKRKVLVKKENLKNAFFFFLISLSGVLPMIISMKQRSFYIVPALPFLAVSFAFIINDLINAFPKLIIFFKKKFFIPVSYGLLGLSLVMISIFAGKPGRDTVKIDDINTIKECIPTGEIIGIDKKLNADWSLYAYLQRYGKYSLTDKLENSKYLLKEKQTASDLNYQKIDIQLKKYNLYKKKNSE